jgi:methyl-accepting chemotaxis protein
MKFLVPTLVLIVAGMGISNTLSYSRSKQALLDDLAVLISNTLDYTVKNLNSWLTDRKSDLDSWSRLEMALNSVNGNVDMADARTKMTEYLTRIRTIYPYYENICIVDSNGLVVAAGVPEHVGKINVADRSYFKESMKGKDYLSEMIVSKATGNPIICFSKPLTKEGQAVGVIFSVVDLGSFSKEYIDTVKIGKTGYGYIFDREGRVIAHPNKDMILKINARDQDFGRRIMEMGNGTIDYKFKGVDKKSSFQIGRAHV